MRRSNQLVFAGIAFFVLGAAVVFLLRDSGNGTSSSEGTTAVLFAKQDIQTGQLGEDIKNQVEVKQIPLSQKLPDALISPSQLSNQRTTQLFAKGDQIRFAGLAVQSLLSGTTTVGKGKEAVPVQVPFVSGGAGYIAPLDLVNVYLVIPDLVKTLNDNGTSVSGKLPYSSPRVELLLTNVKVLDVSTQIAPLNSQTVSTVPGAASTTRSTGSGQLVLLLELDPFDAEKVIFGSQVQSNFLYVTRVNKDATPSPATRGRDYVNILDEEAIAAFVRENK